jgi:ABC-type nitrate/sulfonate/bicarbonate transport system permease component
MENKIKTILLGSIPFLIIFIVWYLFSIFNVFPSWLLPSPIYVINGFFKLLIDGTLTNLILISLGNLLPPFIIAFCFSIILGVLIGINHNIRKIMGPFLGAIYVVPSLAWLPFIILFLGFTKQTIWCVIFISCFLKMIYNIIGGVQGVDKKLILVAKNIGLNKIQIIFKVILPSAFPSIITGVRLGFGSAWRSLVGVEMLVVIFGGLGKFIWMAQWHFNFLNVFIGVFLIAIIGLVMEELVFKKIEKATLVKWGIIS